MSLLQVDYCNYDGTVAVEDIDCSESVHNIPDQCKVGLTIDYAKYGVVNGVAWLENRHYTNYHWIIDYLFRWMIAPKQQRYVCVHSSEDSGFSLDYVFPMDTTMTLHDNLNNNLDKFEAKQIWFTP